MICIPIVHVILYIFPFTTRRIHLYLPRPGVKGGDARSSHKRVFCRSTFVSARHVVRFYVNEWQIIGKEAA